jgi:preprotein translocase subunit SecG
MHIVVVLLHVLACIGLIMIVLLQRGKGADLGAAFGGSSQTVFGSQGAGGFLTKMTTAVAVLFMFTSLGLAYLSSTRVQATVMGGVEQAQEVEAPAPADDPFAADAEAPVAEPTEPAKAPAPDVPVE